MKKQLISIIISVMFIVSCFSFSYAEELQNITLEQNNVTNTVNETSLSEPGTIYVDGSVGNDSWDGTSFNHTGGNTGPFKTVSKGVDALNKNKGGTLSIAHGIYNLSSTLTLEHDSTILGNDMDGTILDGTNKTRIFTVNEGITVKMVRLTIRNGKGDKDGGGIYNKGILSLVSCVVVGNRGGNGRDADFTHHATDGGNGGGIYNTGTLILQDSLVHDNVGGEGGDATEIHSPGSGGNGGGIYNTGTLTIENTNIFQNNAGIGGKGALHNERGGEGGYGGGIYNENTLTINGNPTNIAQIYNNNAGMGGTAYDEIASGGNGGKAGAIYNKKDCNITYTDIYNNNAGLGNTNTDGWDVNGGNGGNGGALYNEGNLNLKNCNINNNQAGTGHDGYKAGNGGNGGLGGAIYNTGILSTINCQIISNKAGDAGKGANEYVHSVGPLTYNAGTGGDGGSGGAIYNTGTLTLSGSAINQNIAGNGGFGGKGAAEGIASDGMDQVSIEDPGNGGKGGSGGGIYNSGTINSITDSTINNNNAGNGGDGGLYSDQIALNLWYKVNPATVGMGGSGGGIHSTGTMNTLENTVISGNVAGTGGNGNPISRYPAETGGSGGNGGALALYSPVQISNCQISGNNAGNGGTGGSIAISGNNPSTQPGNGGDAGSGGGIYYYCTTNNQAANFKVISSTFDSNSAGKGGNGGLDNSNSPKPSNGGSGGNGGAITVASKNIANPDYSLKIYVEQSNILNNHAGTGGKSSNTGTSIDGVGGALYSNDNHYFIVHFCRILDNTPQAVYLNLSSSNSYTNFFNNWWGSNLEPNTQITGKHIDPSYYTPWIVLTSNSNSTLMRNGETALITANLFMNSAGENTLTEWNMHVPDNIPVLFSTNSGTLNPLNNATFSGSTSTVFTANTPSDACLYATVDKQTVNTTIPILLSADMSIKQSVDNARPNVGDTVTFTVAVQNNGPDSATNIQVKDIMPPGLQNVTFTPSTGMYNDFTGIWSINELLNNGNATLKVTGIVNADIAGKTTTNTADIIKQDQYDPNLDNNNVNVSFYVPRADVSIFNTPNQPRVNVGDNVTFTVVVRNNGPDKATNVIINDILSLDFTAQINKGRIYDGVWSIGTLEENEEAILTLTGTINSDFAGKTLYNNVSECQREYNSNPVTVSSGVYVPLANVSITKKTLATHYDVNDTVLFFVMLKNNGLNDATDIKVSDILSDDLEFISASNGGVYDPVKKTVNWYMDKLGNGLNKIFILKTKIKSNISSDLISNSVLESQNEYNAKVKNSTTTITVNEADLYLNGSLNNFNPRVGDKFVVRYKLGNLGPNNARNTVITIPVPVGLDYAGVNVDKGVCRYDSSVRAVTWSVGEVPVGDPYLYLNLKAVTQGQYTLTPSISTTTYDPHLENMVTPLTVSVLPAENKNKNDTNKNNSNVIKPNKDDSSTINYNIFIFDRCNPCNWFKLVDIWKNRLPLFLLLIIVLAVLSGLVYYKTRK